MDTCKVSVICTVKNEESSIGELVESLLSQSREPDEIVIVDGGSQDKTVEIVRKWIGIDHRIRLIVEPGSNISRGRNVAISHATYETIACTDAGCRPDRGWLENISRPFMENLEVDVVAGAYMSVGGNLFEKCVVKIFMEKNEVLEKWTEDAFLPSGKSIAFRKSAWNDVGGYPESLEFAEDTYFSMRLKARGHKLRLAQDAIVYWAPRRNLRSLFKQNFNYTKWDVIAGIYLSRRGPLWILACTFLAILTIAMTYFLGLLGLLVVVLLILLYLARFGISMAIAFRKPACFFYGMAIAATLRLSDLLGPVAGGLDKITRDWSSIRQ
jgi:glycosyltransferase involved in cell wall biosynthesis